MPGKVLAQNQSDQYIGRYCLFNHPDASLRLQLIDKKPFENCELRDSEALFRLLDHLIAVIQEECRKDGIPFDAAKADALVSSKAVQHESDKKEMAAILFERLQIGALKFVSEVRDGDNVFHMVTSIRVSWWQYLAIVRHA